MATNDTIKRAAMRAQLREWGSRGRLTRELEREMRAAAREYDTALGELREAKRRESEGPRRGQTHAAARRAAKAAEDIAERYAAQYEDLRCRVAQRTDTDETLNAALDVLDERAQLVLRMRYMRGMSWAAIGIACGCDESNTRRVERTAVDALCGVGSAKKQSS